MFYKWTHTELERSNMRSPISIHDSKAKIIKTENFLSNSSFALSQIDEEEKLTSDNTQTNEDDCYGIFGPIPENWNQSKLRPVNKTMDFKKPSGKQVSRHKGIR